MLSISEGVTKMICSVAINDLVDLANGSLMSVSSVLGLSAGVVFWWFMLKD